MDLLNISGKSPKNLVELGSGGCATVFKISFKKLKNIAIKRYYFK
jgi:hypothetical protein